jgi:DNA-binding Lrp family transcriptional regulator
MNAKELAKRLEGMHTVETIEKELDISRVTAINYISLLRKAGFIKTERGAKKKRLYKISPIQTKGEGNPGLYEIINKYSKIKIEEPYKTFIHGKKLEIEEAIMKAIGTGSYRVIIAAMPLFNHVKDWDLFSRLAKEYRIENKAGALYDLARATIRVRKMDPRTEKSLEERSKKMKKAPLIKGIEKESDFKSIGKKWNVIIGINKKDLERLKE